MINLKKIIREEIDEWDWARDIRLTLGQMFSNGLVSEGDILILQGDVLNNDGSETKYFDNFKIEISTGGKSISNSKFIPLTEEGSEWVGYTNKALLFYDGDADLFVIGLIKNNNL